jgi:peptidoglycan/LPS O-acetylase OafA/YrhL
MSLPADASADVSSTTPAPTIDAAGPLPAKTHLGVLDGWRGISILLVLMAHLLPLGPKRWELNETAGPMGMAVFFTLSGFLITRLLLADADVPRFLIRRVLRIVPLAWLAMALAFALTNTPRELWLPNFFFYANLPPMHLADVASHFWSLCVEMQFYLAVALIVLVARRHGLLMLPIACIAFTALRVAQGAYVDIVTWRRVDEILAGATLALVFERRLGTLLVARVSRCNVFVVAVLFAVSSHPASGFMNYLRPYLAALMVGTTLFAPPDRVRALLTWRVLRYIAAISFALYVIHGMLIDSWLASGEKLVKYLKRPLLIAVTFALAHLSTYHFERHWIALGRRLTERRPSR